VLVRPHIRVGAFLSAFVFIGMILSGLSACTQQQSNNPIKIGVTVPLTGEVSSDGEALRRGYNLWANAVNKRGGLLGRPVQMDIEDDQSNGDTASTLYNNMVTHNHDDFLFSSFTDASTIAGARVAEYYGYPFIEGSGEAPITFQQGLKTLFSVSLSATHYMDSFANYILSLPESQKPQTVAYATSDDPFTEPQVLSIQDKFNQGHISQVTDIRYPADATNYETFAQQIVASQADVVVLGTLSQQDCIVYVKYFKQHQFNPLAIIAASGPDQGNAFTDAIGGPDQAQDIFVPNDGWFPTLESYQNDQFTTDYIAQYGGTADQISSDTVQAYSVGQVLEQAVNKIQSLDHATIINELRSDTFDSLQGPVKFGPDGENIVSTPFLFQWQEGQLIPVFPMFAAQKNPELHHYFGLGSH
jgi:branched-chain amino acid transport system substrate-binding protein